MTNLPGEAWAFFGVAITAIMTLLTTVIVSNRQDTKKKAEENSVPESKAPESQESAPVVTLPTPRLAPDPGDALEEAVGRALDTVFGLLADANRRLDSVQNQLTQTKDELREARAETRTLTRQNLEYQVTVSSLQSELNIARQALASAEAELRVLRQRGVS